MPKTFRPFGSTSRKQKGDEQALATQLLDLVIHSCAHAERALLLAERVIAGEPVTDDERAQLVANIPRIRVSLKQTAATLERIRSGG